MTHQIKADRHSILETLNAAHAFVTNSTEYKRGDYHVHRLSSDIFDAILKATRPLSPKKFSAKMRLRYWSNWLTATLWPDPLRASASVGARLSVPTSRIRRREMTAAATDFSGLAEAIRLEVLFTVYAGRVICFDTKANRRGILAMASRLHAKYFPAPADEVTCEDCDGSGETGRRPNEYPCPACKGRGYQIVA